MGYDVCAATLLDEKHAFLKRAARESALLCFQHDRDVALARLTTDERGQVTISHTESQVTS
jgi:hypothetical protein